MRKAQRKHRAAGGEGERKNKQTEKKTLPWMVWDEDDDDVPLHAPLILRDCETGGGGKDYPGDKRKEDREEGEARDKHHPGRTAL